MDQQLNLIFELKDLKKTYKKNTVLSIGRLQFHRGTIYGIVGPIGSGKTTLLNIMAGFDRQSSGTIKYDNNEFKTSWFGKIKQNPNHIIYVAIDNKKIVGSTTLLIEQKFIHDGGLVGHIEDVVVRKDYEGNGIGIKLVTSLLERAKEKNCYKTILDCKDDVKQFYERIGFKRESNGMRYDHN